MPLLPGKAAEEPGSFSCPALLFNEKSSSYVEQLGGGRQQGIVLWRGLTSTSSVVDTAAHRPRWHHDVAVAIHADAPMPPAYGMALAMHSMVEEIQGRGTARPSFDQAWQVERIQEAVRRSSSERRWVKIAEVG